MRRFVARAAVSLLPAALLLPFGGVASAGTCVAVGDAPHMVPRKNGIHASGTFACADETQGMTVVVCIEELMTGLAEDTWWQRGCANASAGEQARQVTAEVEVDMMVYSTWLRTTVTGVNAAGDTATFTGPPVLWFNCACYIG